MLFSQSTTSCINQDKVVFVKTLENRCENSQHVLIIILDNLSVDQVVLFSLRAMLSSLFKVQQLH